MIASHTVICVALYDCEGARSLAGFDGRHLGDAVKGVSTELPLGGVHVSFVY